MASGYRVGQQKSRLTDLQDNASVLGYTLCNSVDSDWFDPVMEVLSYLSALVEKVTCNAVLAKEIDEKIFQDSSGSGR